MFCTFSSYTLISPSTALSFTKLLSHGYEANKSPPMIKSNEKNLLISATFPNRKLIRFVIIINGEEDKFPLPVSLTHWSLSLYCFTGPPGTQAFHCVPGRFPYGHVRFMDLYFYQRSLLTRLFFWAFCSWSSSRSLLPEHQGW